MSFTLKEDECTAIYFFDAVSKTYTFTMLEKGGPIIMDTDLENGKKSFSEALHFAYSVRNLQYFDDISVAKRAAFERSRNKSDNKIIFQELQVA